MPKIALSRRKALKIGRRGLGAAAGAHPHRRRGRQGLDRLLGPLGAGRQRRHEEAVRRLRREEQGRGPGRLHHHGRQQEPADARTPRRRPRPATTSQSFPTWEAQNHADDLEPMDDVMARLTGKYRPGQRGGRVPGARSRATGWPCRPQFRHPDEGPVRAHQHAEGAAGLDVVKMFPAHRRHAPAPRPGPGMPSSRPPRPAPRSASRSASGSAPPPDSVDTAGCPVRRLSAPNWSTPRATSRCKSDAVRQVLEFAQRLVKFAAEQRRQLRRRLQQPGADLRPERADLQSAFGLGGGQARRPAGGRRLLALPARRPARRGASCPYVPYFWGVWKFSQEQDRGQGTDRVPDAARERGGALQRRRRLRHAAVRQHARLQGLGERRAAEGHACTTTRSGRSTRRTVHIAALPAPPEIAVQIYNQGTMPTMMAKLLSGQSIPQVIAWAAERAGRLRPLSGPARPAAGDPPAARPVLASHRGGTRWQTAQPWRSRSAPPSPGGAARKHAAVHAAALDRRLPDVLAADAADRRPGGLSGLLRDLPRRC